MSKELILSNLKLLRDAVEAQPEQLFDLGRYKQEEPCGTLFCTAGLAATMPAFQKQGMRLVKDGLWWMVTVDGNEIYDSSADDIFGYDCFNVLFDTRELGSLDEEHPLYYKEDGCLSEAVSDKALALWRLDRQIEAVLSEGHVEAQ